MATKQTAVPANGLEHSRLALEVVLPHSRTDMNGSRVENRILLSIPDEEYATILPYLEYVDLPMYRSLHEADHGFHFGYFLNSGLASLVVATSDGRSVEVGIVGKEGFVGAPLAAGITRSPYGAIVQAVGHGFRIKAEILEVTLGETPDLRFRLNRYGTTQGMQV